MARAQNKDKLCAERGCRRGAYCRGLCSAHYQRFYEDSNRKTVGENKRRYRQSKKGRRVRKKYQQAYNKKRRDQIYAGSLRRRFGLSWEDYQRMLGVQKGVCAVCEKPSKYRLAVDHCHRTGKVRSLLCVGCNTFVGKIEKDLTRLEAALRYLSRFSYSGS